QPGHACGLRHLWTEILCFAQGKLLTGKVERQKKRRFVSAFFLRVFSEMEGAVVRPGSAFKRADRLQAGEAARRTAYRIGWDFFCMCLRKSPCSIQAFPTWSCL